jgi:hypothetical protein
LTDAQGSILLLQPLTCHGRAVTNKIKLILDARSKGSPANRSHLSTLKPNSTKFNFNINLLIINIILYFLKI